VSESACPVNGKTSIPASNEEATNQHPVPSVEEAANHSQLPIPGQRIRLATQRDTSSIPRGQPDTNQDENRWQYPSEQQFYNAMLKKGHRPPVEAIPSVLRIHNAVNEQSWLQLCRWERELHDNPDPRLVRFVGRPKDLSPKAWWNSRVLMKREPFDRHDWFVADAAGGEPRRYVLDFYEGGETARDPASAQASEARHSHGGGAANRSPVGTLPSMYIDVRRAVDDPSAAVDRAIMFAREALPGIAGAWDSYRTPASPQSSGVTPAAEVEDVKNEKGRGK